MPSVAVVAHHLSPRQILFSLLPVILAGLLLPIATLAQVSYTGTAGTQNFGSQPVGSTSVARSFSFSIAAGTTVGSIGVVTQGAPNLDFVNATGSTCTAMTYALAANCTVNVTFKPEFAVQRKGAVVFFSRTNTVLGMVPIYGTGTGPQVALNFPPAIAADPLTQEEGLFLPEGLAVDGTGDLFIADFGNSRVVEIYGDGSNAIDPTVNGLSLSEPTDVALDGAGDLYISDFGRSWVVKVPSGGGAAIAIQPTVDGTPINGPSKIALDGAGDLFIADGNNSRVVEVPVGGGAAIAIDPTVDGKGLNQYPIYGIAVDGAGDLFISDDSNDRVLEVPAGGGAAIAIQPSFGGTALFLPMGLAVDGAGDLFIGDLTGRVLEVPASGGQTIAFTATVNGVAMDDPYGVALDGAGDLFIADQNNYRIVEFQRSQPPLLLFPTPTTVGGIDTTDNLGLVQVQNMGNEELTLTALNLPADFSAFTGGSDFCATPASLSAGQVCNVFVQFAPQNTGILNEDITLIDNSLNVAGTQQSIDLTGRGVAVGDATQFSVTTTGPVSPGRPFTITVTALYGSNQVATSYNGTVTFTSSDPWFVNPGLLSISGGTGHAIVTLATMGTQTITATETMTTLPLTGIGSFSVIPFGPVQFTGTSANENFGSQAIGSTSAAGTFNFSIPAGTTVGSIGVVTQGAPNLDFTSAAGGTCTAMTYASATTCTVNVTFKPRAAGTRMGAVVFFSAANNTGTILGSAPIYGIGTGAQVAYSPATAIALTPTVGSTGLKVPVSVAVDGAGDLFISDQPNQRVLKVPTGGGAAVAIDPTVNGSPLSAPQGLAVDGAGDLFIADEPNNRVVEVPAGGGAALAIDPNVDGKGLFHSLNVAVDEAGDLFITDVENNRVVKYSTVGGSSIAIATADVPYGLAIDSAGDLFITYGGLGTGAIEIPAGGGAWISIDPTVNGTTVGDSDGLAVDGVGDLFIADESNNRVVEVPVGGGAATAVDPVVDGIGLNKPGMLAVDGAGNLFIGDPNNARVVELQRPQPLALVFPTATNVGLIDTTDGTQTVQVQNIGNTALTLTALSYPADFSEASGDASACTGTTSLSAGQECDLPVEFTPQNAGALRESITLTDNPLNVAGTQQVIQVSGTGLASPVLISPTPGSTLGVSNVTFTWTPGAGVTNYDLWVGVSGVGSSDLYSSGVTMATSATVPNLPARGAAVYARLYALMNGVWQHADYTYTETTGVLATMTSPAPTSTLGTSNVMFTWTAGTGVTHYALWLGLNGPGSSDLYASGTLTTTSATVPSLPARGATIYARLYSEIDGVFESTDYTYTETTGVLATMTTPTPGSTLGTSNVTFTWTAGTGVTHYTLWLGLSGPGSSDLYTSGTLTTTSATVPSLPARGAMIYARLYSEVNGVFEPTDYMYTEQ